MTPATPPSDIAFTPTVKAIQARKGSRDSYEQMERRGGWKTEIDEGLAECIQAQRSFFFATANAQGQPYIQHRGGPPGFLHVVDSRTLAMADFRGNRQYISQGNLEDNARAFIFLIDYARRQRVKVWGRAKMIEGDDDLAEKLMPPGYNARAEQVLIFEVDAWDANCPQHIPQRFEAEDVAATLAERDRRIADLEAEIAEMRRVQKSCDKPQP